MVECVTLPGTSTSPTGDWGSIPISTLPHSAHSESIHTPLPFPHLVVLQHKFKMDSIEIMSLIHTHTHTHTHTHNVKVEFCL
jgi:hypothetical protein